MKKYFYKNIYLFNSLFLLATTIILSISFHMNVSVKEKNIFLFCFLLIHLFCFMPIIRKQQEFLSWKILDIIWLSLIIFVLILPLLLSYKIVENHSILKLSSEEPYLFPIFLTGIKDFIKHFQGNKERNG